MWAFRAARVRWRIYRASFAERELGAVPKNERERRFCAIFARECIERAIKNGNHLTNAARVEAATAAARGAGYPERREYAVRQRGIEQMSLPRTQAGVLEIFRASGVDVERCGAVLAEVMNEGEPADKLRAVEIFFKTTIGFAPAKSANIHGIASVDGFFDEKEFASTPPIRTAGGNEPKTRAKK